MPLLGPAMANRATLMPRGKLGAPFVDVAEKLFPKYDCTENGQPVPAIFLCDRFGPKLARKIFGSEALRDTLDGDLAEHYREKSEATNESHRRR